MREPLTKRQQEIVNFIEEYTKRHTYRPDMRAMMTGLGFEQAKTLRYQLEDIKRKTADPFPDNDSGGYRG